MNPKIFAKAFSDIKKQAQLEQSKTTRKLNNAEGEAAQLQVSSKTKVQTSKIQAINVEEDDEDDKKQGKREAMNKKIVKQNVKKSEAIVKKWKEQFYKKEAARKARLILVENSNSNEVLNVIKNYKMDIQQIYDDRVVMSSEEKAKQCIELLKKSGITVKGLDEQKEEKMPARQNKEGEKKSSIFSRIQ